MKFLQPTENVRLNEPIGFVLLIAGIALGLGLVSHHPFDPSWNVAAPLADPQNLMGYPGAYLSDLALQWLGVSAFLFPLYVLILGWRWVRSAPLRLPLGRLAGALLLVLIVAGALGVWPGMRLWSGTVSSGGLLGAVLAESLVRYLNEAGALLTFLAGGILSLYLLTSFSLGPGSEWVADRSNYLGLGTGRLASWRRGLAERMRGWLGRRGERRRFEEAADFDEPEQRKPPLVRGRPMARQGVVEEDDESMEGTELPPIVPYEAAPSHAALPEEQDLPFEVISESEPARPRPPRTYHLPSTLLLRQPPERGAYNPEELHQLARQICAKFEEFGVHGSVTQINPGPVVTTFEFKPDAGIKYSRITNLSEDLCLALECESVMVERIPGKSTIGIEVPNRRRETIVLREMIESPEFTESASFITMVLGKDINGRNRVANLATMPHLLIAGSTGAGKSVLVNSIIMSILFKAAPDQVRFVMVDPKTVELGLYVDIPHLLTPVITDMKKASNALKNATREMERRLKLLAEFGVRNIDQFNEKIGKLDPDVYEGGELPGKLPYIVIIIDELADLMMLEGRQIEESITRLAQMARAVGIHLILATQRPSVDVITGLIKANIPARISFRLATRVDSRTILDAMGAESLLGRGDMLFLPPASGRMVRLHGPLVTEEEIQAVVRAWKEQGKPDYENAFLAPPEDEAGKDGADDEGFDDPAYEDAVRVVLDMGKASTSTLQRRLRLGYGRAARILDAMERDGIIGPPDGSRPREVLKRPDWLVEVGR
jgi:DNA segregation ATPase FtsK/SpoIIIE, S-DNA-T family